MTTGAFGGGLVVVTGAGQGIGRACAAQAAAAGAAVLAVDVDGARASDTRDLIVRDGGRAAAYMADVTDPAGVAAALGEGRAAFGPPVALIHSAGGMAGAPAASILQADLADVERVVRLNLLGTFTVLQAMAREMDGDPARDRALVVVASLQGVRGSPQLAAYGASKAGMLHLVQTAALELAPRRIRVNAVSPTITDTPSVQAMVDGPRRAASEQAIPLGRIGQSDDVAAAAVMLASPSASFVTGQNLVVDGGLSLTTARAVRS